MTEKAPIVLTDADTKDYRIISRLSLLFFTITAVLFVSYFILKNNKQPQLALAGIQISAISLLYLFIIT